MRQIRRRFLRPHRPPRLKMFIFRALRGKQRPIRTLTVPTTVRITVRLGVLDRSGPFSKENWTDWNRYGWFVCPGSRQRTCSDPACAIGVSCKRMAELGLAGDGTPLRRKDRPRCGARTRKGDPCLVRVEPGKRRCRFHGGLSTGPRTAEGKARIAAAQRNRWAKRRSSVQTRID